MATPDDVTAASPSSWLSGSEAISHGRFAPGVLLADRYRIVGLLGKGGMGEVYRADDLKLGQQVALKFLPEHIAHDPVRLAQFHGEVRLARQISHPNVCRVYDIGDVNGHPFLTMEYVDGEDLASLLRRIGRLPEDKALEIARQFCAGVAAAHARGVLHRDLKPANVMIDGRGQVRVMDFGLAAAIGTSVDVRSGTPAYMAPEQLAGRDVSVRSDVYAIGLVLYELVTGRRAFEAANLAELLRLHAASAVTPPTAIVPSLDVGIERAILRCLDPDPTRRPGSGLAVAAALPGGDPLAAALAAGETPSPAMVAAAGREDAIAGPIAVGSLALIAVVLAVLPMIRDQTLLLRAIPPPKAIDVLIDRAQAIRRAAGYDEPPRDEAYGIEAAEDYLDYIERNDPAPGRWQRLQTGRAAAVTFWYRTSPRDLVAISPIPEIGRDDPVLTLSGMTLITLDMQGRLVEFTAVPAQREADADTVRPVDWTSLFLAAELPSDALTFSPPQWIPPVYADTRAAWVGAIANDPDAALRIEAAAYGGRPVYFQVIWPWSRATRMEDAERGSSGVVAALLTGVWIFLIVGACLVARQQLRRGAADRRSADRTALVIVVALAISWPFSAHHVADFVAEFSRFSQFLAIILLVAGSLWVFYLALEPLVRKWNPRALIGWTRLLRGTVRDPQVGRDVLTGIVGGVLFELVRAPRSIVSTLAGAPPDAPIVTSFASLVGIRQTLGEFAEILPNAVTNGMLLILLFALLRAVVRRTWIAVSVLSVIAVALVAFQSSSSSAWWTQLPLAVAALLVLFTVVVRFGLLATVVMFYIAAVLEVIPVTADPSMRYFSTSMWTLLGIAALAALAARAARAGQPLFVASDSHKHG